MPKLLQCLLFIAPITLTVAAHSQAIPLEAPTPIHVCPGAFPTDLTSTDCRYKVNKRTLEFVDGSLTDQAVLGAVIFGLGGQIVKNPSEWGRTWDGYGKRVGSRYTQAVGKGAAQYIVGLMLNDDPRFLAYRDEPAKIRRRQDAVYGLSKRSQELYASPSLNSSNDVAASALNHDGWQRFGHAWYDVVTVRRSTIPGDGRRIPAFSRFAGEFAGAYAGSPWYRASDNTFAQVGQRAAGAFGTAVLSSFYTEYTPEITNLLGAIFRHGGQPKSRVKDSK